METLGFTPKVQALIPPSAYAGFELARVVAEHKERYVIRTAEGTYGAIITGNLRFSASSRADFPAVGDWVKVAMMDADTAIIYGVLPRLSVLERQAVGQFAEKQLIATNIDYAFLVQALGQDFNLNRLERYLVICQAAHIEPIVLLNKIDTVPETEGLAAKEKISQRHPGLKVILLSAYTGQGIDELKSHLEAGCTYCFLGSSGVGKSTLLNALLGEELAATQTLSQSTHKGQHTTTHRALFQLPNGSLLIDTPGMRELGMVDHATGTGHVFSTIEQLAQTCKFKNCQHSGEEGCAIAAALERGDLEEAAWTNYQKIQREQAHFSRSLKEKRDQDKAQGKLYKRIQAAHRKRKG